MIVDISVSAGESSRPRTIFAPALYHKKDLLRANSTAESFKTNIEKSFEEFVFLGHESCYYPIGLTSPSRLCKNPLVLIKFLQESYFGESLKIWQSK